MTKNQLPPVLRRWRFVAVAVGVAALAGGGVLMAATSDPTTAMAFHNVTTVRLLDTRPATQVGTRSTPLGLAGTFDLVIPNLPTDATAVSVNVTAVDGTEGSFLTLYPTTDTRPLASTINWEGPAAVANSATVNVHPDHSVRIYNLKGTVNVVIDLLGYYAPSPVSGGTVVAASPHAYLYANSTQQSTVLVDTSVAFDNVVAQTPGSFTTDVVEDAFTVTAAGTYKVSFGVASLAPSQLTVEVDGIAPIGGAMVFGADTGTTAANPGGTAVVTVTAGQTITVASRSADIDLTSAVGGSDSALTAWIMIEQLS